MADDLQQQIDAALRTGDIDGAARVVMQHKGISLDEARKQVHEILKARQRK